MTTLHEWTPSNDRNARVSEDSNTRMRIRVDVDSDGAERREHRRHDLEMQNIAIDRWDASRRNGETFGRLVDLSAGGVRIRTQQKDVKPDNQIRIRLELPDYAGISPFVDMTDKKLQPKREWVGWLAVTRVKNVENRQMEVAGRLVGMEEMDRGMLGLYLSTQPLAA